VEAHPGASVSAILPTPHFIVTSGTDDKVFIWDKQTGNLVHTIPQVTTRKQTPYKRLSFPEWEPLLSGLILSLNFRTESSSPFRALYMQYAA
jgi:WD40 repeat protein